MSTVAAACAGDVAVIWPSVSTLKEAALTVPNFTELAPVKCEPLIVTDVPPAAGPAVGFTDVTVGASTKVNTSKNDVADVPPTVVTVTSTPPAACAGDTAVIELSVSTVKLAAFIAPNFTEVAPVKCEPLIVTDVPPALGPAVGFSDVTTGASTKVKRSKNDVTDVPAEFVTVTSIWPAAWAGEVAVMWLASTTLTEVPAAPPKSTVEPVMK